MTDILDHNWQISADAVANQVGNETVILHMGNGTYYGLDTIGTALWDGLKAGKTPIEVCDQIAAEYDVDRSTVLSDMREFLNALADQDLVSKSA
ncbi:MAG: PqqD family protein [Erythrobacter sp.]|nr:PqqD family protein [Erythrobacter sp.]